MATRSAAGLRRRGAADEAEYEPVDTDDNMDADAEEDKYRKFKSQRQRDSERSSPGSDVS